MNKIVIIIFSLFMIIGFNSCVDNTIDEPPIKELPTVETNATLADIKSKWIAGEFVEITEDLIFDAVVVADDESGNFYKNIVVQDETGGIAIRIEANNIYTILPVGRQVYVHAKGLVLSDYNGLPQLGYAEEDGSLLTIPFPLVDEDPEIGVITPGAYNQEVNASTVTINSLTDAHINTLVKFEKVQFLNGELGQTYADADTQTTLNRSIEDCDGNVVIIRTSGYCDFAGEEVAGGAGSLAAIYSVFGDTKQMLLRDLTDVELSGDRCDDINIDLPTPNATLADVLVFFVEGEVNQITEDLIFDAVVIADDESGNFYQNLVIQDETGGISVRIGKNDLYTDYNVGREVVIKAKDLVIGDYNGLPQLGYDEGSGTVERIEAEVLSSIVFRGNFAGAPAGAVKSISDITSDDLNTLVTINDVEFASSSLGMTFADGDNNQSLNHDVNDCDDNTIIMRSSGYADFAGITLPDGNGTVTGVVSTFSGTMQLIIRKVQDVNMGGDRCDGTGTGDAVEEIDEDFGSQASDQDVNLSNWENVVGKGVRKWRGKEYDDNIYVQATAYNDDEPETETWLISPEIKMSGSNVLTFKSAMAFYEHDGLTVLVSTNYDGDVNAASWDVLNPLLAGSSQDNYEWVESGDVDLSSYSDNIHIAFKYEGTSSSNTTSYSIDDVKVTK